MLAFSKVAKIGIGVDVLAVAESCEIRLFQVARRHLQIAGQVDLDGNSALRAAVSGVESRLGDSGRVLLRPSGTEPLVRVMVEGDNMDVITLIAEEVAGVIKSSMS